MNNFCFSGNLGRDAELRHTPNGVAVCSFPVPCTSGWGDNQKVMWVDCSIWRERGEKLVEYLKKGTPVMISGELTLSEPYQTKSGETKVNARCSVIQITLGKAAKDDPAAQPKGKPEIPVVDDFQDDDIPF